MNQSRLVRLQSQPDALSDLLAGLSVAQWQRRVQPGKWSIAEQLAHLARYQVVFRQRIDLICQTDQPHFDRYMADDDPDFAPWLTRLPDELLTQLQQDRAEINNKLAALTGGQLRRTGTHPTFGAMDIEGWTEFFLLHEAHHFLSIMRLAASARHG
ncbi:DinB family protein [Fibrella sp. HMF5335]|uniref:DinB family protein n=1 Tax=Fibrella rubiginis TaxID=2817060 RepID=A0A939GLD8_9BACT|nr:DinB family protein [Fibrella rubiginis]MBO0939560.1 DinB family protein [Fibrella rubiginis]